MAYKIFHSKTFDEEFGAVFMVAISGKTDQQKAINAIFLLLSVYKKEVLNLLKQSDVT